MKRKLQLDDSKRRDERVAEMLDRHVRGSNGSAPILTRTDGTLRKRLATLAS